MSVEKRINTINNCPVGTKLIRMKLNLKLVKISVIRGKRKINLICAICGRKNKNI